MFELRPLPHVTYDIGAAGDVIEVDGLTTGDRINVEKVIYQALTRAAASMGADAAAAESVIRASLDALPLDLP